ncbi:MAG: DNA-protecting protein DprA [Saprospiraceae bacterium]|nr:DNA-protecting protein DprA [Saprospiraceae bacterium]
MPHDNFLYKIALNYIPNVGCINAKKLVAFCGSAKGVFEATRKELSRIPGIGEKRIRDIMSKSALRKAEHELTLVNKQDIQLYYYLDEDYPIRLKQYPDAPIILYHRGNTDINSSRTVSIVGTRQATARGLGICREFVENLKSYECLIISGLAYGIDSCAHKTALENQIPTLAVVGTGLASIYPAANRKLAHSMLKNGGVLSEFPMNTKADRENFPRRNRIIAGLSDVILVIESGLRGGSVITAKYGNDYAKDVFAIPGRISDPLSEGCNQLIKTHQAHLCSSVDDISYIMGWDHQHNPKQLKIEFELEKEEQLIIDLIRSKNEISLELIHYESGISFSALSSLLLGLEFKGLVTSIPGKKYILT